MIKFFRKIRYDLIEKNKTGKYLKYAIGEIILVMIGILLALQVNEWNKERNRKMAEQKIITQLQTDLKQSQIELENIKDFYLGRARVSAQVKQAFWKSELPDNIKDYIFGGMSSRIYSPILGTARSMINSGNIDIISSTELKNDIISYIEKVDYSLKDINRYEETYYRKGIELAYEAIPNTYLSKEDVNSINRENSRLYANNLNQVPLKVDKVPFKSDINELFEDERFFKAYHNLYISHRNIYYQYHNILEITNELLDKLNQASDATKNLSPTTIENHYLVFEASDLKILQKADVLLSDSSKWNNKQEYWNCDNDIANEKYSIYCALYKACMEVNGKVTNEESAMEIILYTIKKYENRRVIKYPEKDWNNHPDTTFEEVKKIFKESIDEVKKLL